MPVVLRVGTLVHCAAPPLVPAHDAHASAASVPHRGLRPLLPSASPTAKETDSSHHGSTNGSLSAGDSNVRHGAGLPLKRLLHRGGKSADSGESPPVPDMLMPLWVSHLLAPDSTCASVVECVSDAVDQQLVRGRLAGGGAYVGLGDMPASWALRRFESGATAAAAAGKASAGHRHKSNPHQSSKGSCAADKDKEKERKAAKKKARKKMRTHSSGSSASSVSSRASRGGAATPHRHRHRTPCDVQSTAWCLCCRDAHGVFRYCGQYTPAPVNGTERASTVRTERFVAPAAGRGTTTTTTTVPSPQEGDTSREVYLTQVAFLVEACVKSHQAVLAVTAAAADAGDADNNNNNTNEETEEHLEREGSQMAPLSLGASMIGPASLARATLTGPSAQRTMNASFLAGMSNSNDDTDELHTLSRYTSGVLCHSDDPRPQPHHILSSPDEQDAHTCPLPDHAEAQGTPSHPHPHHHSHPHRGRAMKFAMLHAVLVPLPVLFMLNPYIAAVEPTFTRRRSRWHRREPPAATAHPASPTTVPTSPRRRRAELKRRPRRACFVLADAVEVPLTLRCEPVTVGTRRSVGTTPPMGPETTYSARRHRSSGAEVLTMMAPSRDRDDSPLSYTAMEVRTSTATGTGMGTTVTSAGSQLTGQRSPQMEFARQHLPPLSPNTGARTSDVPVPYALPQPLSLPPATQQNASPPQPPTPAVASSWFTDESAARYKLSYSTASQRLDAAHKQYDLAVAQMQGLSTMTAVPRTGGYVDDDLAEETEQALSPTTALASLETGMRKAWEQWATLWQVPSPMATPAKTVARRDGDDAKDAWTTPSRPPPSSLAPDAAGPGTIHALVRRQLELTEELKECDEAEREAETLRMLINVYEHDLTASRERQAALHAALQARRD